jgi:hypothetical protein
LFLDRLPNQGREALGEGCGKNTFERLSDEILRVSAHLGGGRFVHETKDAVGIDDGDGIRKLFHQDTVSLMSFVHRHLREWMFRPFERGDESGGMVK